MNLSYATEKDFDFTITAFSLEILGSTKMSAGRRPGFKTGFVEGTELCYRFSFGVIAPGEPSITK